MLPVRCLFNDLYCFLYVVMYYDSMQPEGIKEIQKCDFPDFEN